MRPISMGPILLFIAGFYLFVVGKRQSGPIYNSIDELMGEDVASFMLATLGGTFLAISAFWGMSFLM